VITGNKKMEHKPIYILGTNLSHDGSSCLLKDGEIVAAIEKERITRVKHDGGNDFSTVKYCLEKEGITIEDISLIVQNANFEKDEIEIDRYKGDRFFKKDIKVPIVTISHHLTHAYSALGSSNFESCNVVVIDGCGSPFAQCDDVECETLPTKEHILHTPENFWCEKMSIYKYDSNNGLKPQIKEFSEFSHTRREENFSMPTTIHSIGGVYQLVSNYCFGNMDDVGKLMGLAPYGRVNQFNEKIFELKEGRVFNDFSWQRFLDKPFSSYDNFKNDFQHYADIAYCVQDETEKALVYTFKYLEKKFPNENWAYAGGVGLNAVANAKILSKTDIKNLYIQPAAGDNGIALGCAFYGWRKILKQPFKKHDGSSNFGKKYIKQDIYEDVRLQIVQVQNYIEKTAELLSQGKIIAWFDNGSEFGPRALGYRSILADPTKKGVKDFINKEIKKREDFRPFAPAIIKEEVSKYFKNDMESPYMILVNPMREEYQELLSNVVHKDGTSRVQTVESHTNPNFYSLLKSFGEKNSMPILLNTSFNKKGMPIVETLKEAVAFFKEVPIDYLVLDGAIFSKIGMKMNDLNFNDKVTQKIVDFILQIGLPVFKETIKEETFLPGVLVRNGGLAIDEERLLYPGDLLHEAGHLATLTPQKRVEVYNDVSKNAGDELVTLAWSYAAAKYLNLELNILFHDNGYKGDSSWLVEHYRNGGEMGLPLLEWMGLSYGYKRAEKEKVQSFPAMQKWLRDVI